MRSESNLEGLGLGSGSGRRNPSPGPDLPVRRSPAVAACHGACDKRLELEETRAHCCRGAVALGLTRTEPPARLAPGPGPARGNILPDCVLDSSESPPSLVYVANARGTTCLLRLAPRRVRPRQARDGGNPLRRGQPGAVLPRRTNAGGATCLHAAADRGDWAVAQALLAAADAPGLAGDTTALILAADGSGETCLHAASHAGHAATAAGLAAAGGAGLLVVARAGDGDGATKVHAAASSL